MGNPPTRTPRGDTGREIRYGARMETRLSPIWLATVGGLILVAVGALMLHLLV